MKPSKITVQINGVKLQLPETAIKKTNWKGEPITPYIEIGQVETASLSKQYVKLKYPNVSVSASSDSYSGGCSCNVYLSDEYGFPVSKTIINDVQKFAYQFQSGHFDGMTDSYNYNEVDPTSDNGTRLSTGCSYVFVNNRPKFGSGPDIIRSIREHMEGKYNCGVTTFEVAKTQTARYHKPAAIERALKGVDLKKALKF